jgi:hypothetical protein
MARLYPNRVKAIHITLPSFFSVKNPQTLFYLALGELFGPSLFLSEQEIEVNSFYKFSQYGNFIVNSLGYFHLQATKPDTLGHGLTDSPVGLLAYVLEKYSLGSFTRKAIGNRDGLLSKFDRDDLLTIVMYYWTTTTITSSCRMYKGTFYDREWPKNEIADMKVSSKVAVGVQYFGKEIAILPKTLLKHTFLNLKR